MIAGSFGVQLNVNTGLDITGYTGVTIAIRDPSGHVSKKAAAVLNEATGAIYYITEPGVFRYSGMYQVQAIIDFGASKRLKSDVQHLEVKESL